MDYGSKDPVALIHVCRAWREIFISRSSLWTNFDCMNADKTRVYLERSRSSPVNLWLNRDGVLPPHDPFFQIIPFAFGRLESLFVRATPGNLQDITAHLFCSTPILKRLSINGGCEFEPYRNPVLTTALFNGDLSPLHVLHLQCVRTELPWRNMVNLTSFTLLYTSPAEPSIDQLLDFFKSALRLHEINLQLTTSASPTQSGQLVSLAYLKKMYITGNKSPSLLLDHLLIPVGAMLTTKISYYYSPIEGHLPRSLDNLKNLSNFTKISLRVDGVCSHMRFTGPNGQVSIISLDPPANATWLAVESLARFDTSGAERLDIGANPLYLDPLYRALLPMNNLRTLILSRCENLPAYMYALHPGIHSSNVMVCPKLEELIFIFRSGRERFNIWGLIDVAVERVSRGAKLRAVRIVGRQGKSDPCGVSELREHVLHVKCGPLAGAVSNDSEDGDEATEDSDEDGDDSDEDGDDIDDGSGDSDEEG